MILRSPFIYDKENEMVYNIDSRLKKKEKKKSLLLNNFNNIQHMWPLTMRLI